LLRSTRSYSSQEIRIVIDKLPPNFYSVAATQARATVGIRVPVLLVVVMRHDRAFAINRELNGGLGSLPDGFDGLSGAFMVVCDPPVAASLLRRHAGEAGQAAEALLMYPSPADYWLIKVLPETMTIVSFKDDEPLRNLELAYSSKKQYASSCNVTPEGAQYLEALINDQQGPNMIMLEADDGQKVPVCGRNGLEVYLAGYMVSLVVNRGINGYFAGMPVKSQFDDARLADWLVKMCADKPQAVAEAIRTLRKLKGDQSSWLMRVLRNQMSLVELYQAVRQELADA
jgi:hypothetical protein